MFDPFMQPAELKKILAPYIDAKAKKFGVRADWINAIISHESHWNLCAIRFEPSYPYIYRPQQFIGPLNSLATEINAQKTSWGLGQVMGALAREMHFDGFLAQLIDPELNIDLIAKRILDLMKRTTEQDYIFAGYNGGPGAMRKNENGLFRNQAYVNSVKQYLVKVV